MIKKIAFLLCYIYSTSITLCQTPDTRFTHLTMEDGLSQSFVYDIRKDQQGFMWFATGYGLNFYDGYNFKVYNTDPHNPRSISNSNVRCLLIDSKGTLWAGTYEAGLNRFNRKDGTFTSFQKGAEGTTGLTNNCIKTLYEDKKGTLWIGTKKGLNRFIPEENQMDHFLLQSDNPESIPDNDIQCLIGDPSGDVWVGTWNGLARLYPESGKCKRYFADPNKEGSLSDNTILCLFRDRNQNLWIGTRKGGLNRYDPKTDSFISFRNDPQNPNSVSSNTILCIAEDLQGLLWLGTWNGGINVFDPVAKKFTHLRHNTMNPSGISSDQIWTSFCDESGTLWFGTHGGGIDIFHPIRKNFDHYFHRSEDPNSLSQNMVLSFYEDEMNNIWIGTYSGGLNKFNPYTKNFTHFLRDPGNPRSLLSNRVGRILPDGRGNLWLGTQLTEDAGGLSVLNLETETFRNFVHDPSNIHSISHNEIWALCFDHKGQLWIGTDGGGLDQMDINNLKFIHFKNDPENSNSLSNNRITDILEDKENHIWVGTRDGLNRLNPETGSIKRYFSHPSKNNTISSNYITILFYDSKSQLWIGTRNGLNQYIASRDSFLQLHVQDGLADDYIKGLLEDSRGNYWISTNGGITRYNQKNKLFTSYSMQDGLQSNEFNDNATFRTKDGKLYFGGINGFSAFYPDEIIDNPYVPPIVITELRLFNKPVKPGEKDSPLQQDISETQKINLNYKQNNLSISFVSLNYINTQKNQYRYKLEGFDKSWINNGTNRTATYTNIPPGEYVFHVVGSNNDNLWNLEGQKLIIVISPPIWKRTWFRLLIIVFVLSSGFLLHLMRIRLLKIRQKVLERQVKERTQEIEKQKELLEQNYLDLERQKEEIDHQARAIKRMNDFLEVKNLKLTEDVKDISEARIMQKRVTFEEFREKYPDDLSCYKFLDELKWQKGYSCQKCGSDEFVYISESSDKTPYSRRCKKCKYMESPTIDTIFSHLKFPIVKAFYILFLVSGGKELTADELSDILQLRRQTCWSFQRKVKLKLSKNKHLLKHTEGWIHLIMERKRLKRKEIA